MKTKDENPKVKKVRPLIKWTGGKTQLLPVLLPMVPPHATRVEVFGGGLALTLALPKMRGEIVNDINRDLVNLYRCAQHHLPEMLRLWQWECKARVHFLPGHQPLESMTDIQRAVRFLCLSYASFAGDGSTFGVATGSEAGSGLLRMEEKLREWQARMDGVQIECLPWQRLLKLYDRPDTFFFMDPPYTVDAGSRYDQWGAQDMQALVDALPGIKGRWLLTVDDTPENRARFARYPMRMHEKFSCATKATARSGATKATARKKHRELIISDGKGAALSPQSSVLSPLPS